MATIADPSDVTSRWVGSETVPGNTVIQQFLDDAETLILFEFPDLLERIEIEEADTEIEPKALHDRAVLVEARMVIRALKNPDNIRQRANTTGPFTDSETLAAETLIGLELTDKDRDLLSEASTTTGQKAFTIDPTPPLSTDPLYAGQVNGPAWLAPGYDD